MAIIVFDLKYKGDLRLPELELPMVRCPEQEEHNRSYKKYFHISPKDSRELLQRQIEDELTRIRSIFGQYDLVRKSCFEDSANQSDY